MDPQRDDDDSKEEPIKIGKATFSSDPTPKSFLNLSLEGQPELFLAEAEHRTQHGPVEEDITGNQALQLELLKRLPINKDDQQTWSEVVQALADDYRRTHNHL